MRNYRRGFLDKWFQCNTKQLQLQQCTHSVQVGVGIGVQGGRGLCSPPVRSDKEYLMLVYSRPLILLFCRVEKRNVKNHEQGKINNGESGKSEALSAAHLFLLYASLQRFYVVLYSHVDESVLRLGLHHPRALGTNHLDGLWHVDVAVHPCSMETISYTENILSIGDRNKPAITSL